MTTEIRLNPSTPPAEDLGLPSSHAAVGVIGLGYAGLPMAVEIAASGRPTVGFDVAASVVAALQAGSSHVDTVSDGQVRAVRGTFVATSSPSALRDCSVVVICVPTPLDSDGAPDLRPLRGACGSLSAQLQPGQLVVVESTVFPGCTAEVVQPILERSGLCGGLEFSLAFASERIDPGNRRFDVANTPKVVGGLTPVCGMRAELFYRNVGVPVYLARGLREAEASKVLENSYRMVNIALVNEFAQYCVGLGIDVMDAIGAAATKPFGFAPFYPSAGAGGHCIPVDPAYLSFAARRAGTPITLIEQARRLNLSMPLWFVGQIESALGARGASVAGSTVALFGVTYKSGIADLRNTPAEAIARDLRSKGAHVAFHDPLVETWAVDGAAVHRYASAEDGLADAALVLVLQAYPEYACLGGARTVLDPFDRLREVGHGKASG